MRLSRLTIENFRGIRSLQIDFDDITVIIGENNTGKTAILDALKRCLRDLRTKRGVVFDVYDFHLSQNVADPSAAPPIKLTLTFLEQTVGDWAPATKATFQRARILQVDPDDGRGQVTLQVTCAYDAPSGSLLQDWNFLDRAGAPLTNVDGRSLSILQEEVAYFYLSALRDAARHFDPKGPYWRPFLKTSNLTAQQRKQIEDALQAVNEQIVNSHASFDAARDKLKQLNDVIPLSAGQLVSIEAVPARIFDMLSRTQISLGTPSGARVPVDRHGEGTQSLAVLMLFNAFLHTASSGSPIVALEEPEAHLHPGAVRALWKLIEALPGQKVITTHSGDLLSEVPVAAVRRLRRTAAGEIERHQLKPTTLNADQQRQFNFHVRYMRGELLFARCWLLVEGETEVTLLPEVARLLNLAFGRLGVRLVQYRQSDVAIYLKAANDLGIRWFVLADNDQQGAPDIQKVRDNLAGAQEADVLGVMPNPNIEEYLCAAGFGPVYAAYLTPQTQAAVTVAPGDPNYWAQVTRAIKNARGYSKPAAALQVMAQITGGAAVPPVIEQAVRAAVALAES